MKSVLKSTGLYALGNVLPNLASFVLLPIYTSYLTTDDYGIVSSLQVFSNVLLIFLSLAIERSVPRLYFDYDTVESKKRFLSCVFTFLALSSTVIVACIFLFKNTVQLVYSSIDFDTYFVWAIAGAFFSVFSFVPKVFLRVEERVSQFVTISLSQFVLTTILVLWFVVFMDQGAIGMLKGQALAQFISSIFFIGFSIQKFGIGLHKSILRSTLAFSLPMIPSLLGAWILNLSDRIFLERYLSLSEVGKYSLGYKLASILVVVSSAFFSAYNPLFYKLAKKNTEEVKRKLKDYNNNYTYILIFLTFSLAFYSRDVLKIFFREEYQEAHIIVSIIALAYLISQVGSLLNLSVYQERKSLQMMYIQLFGASLNILLNFILISAYGAVGAAWATVLSFTAIFLIKYFYAKKTYFIEFEWKKIVPLVLIHFLVFLLFYNIQLELITGILIKLCISLILVLVFYKRAIKNFSATIKSRIR